MWVAHLCTCPSLPSHLSPAGAPCRVDSSIYCMEPSLTIGGRMGCIETLVGSQQDAHTVLWLVGGVVSTNHHSIPFPSVVPFKLWKWTQWSCQPWMHERNCYIPTFQDFFIKWPMDFCTYIVSLHCLTIQYWFIEVIPQFGVPESLLSDWGTN